jgi:hypothetical protein
MSPAGPQFLCNKVDLTARVIDLIKANPTTGWAAIVVVDEDGNEVRAVGPTLARFADPGRRLRLRGHWCEHPRLGWQIQVHHAEPASMDLAVEETLAILLRVPYVRSKRAQILVDHYGPDMALLRVDENPRAAFRAIGLPHAHAAAAARWWKETRPIDRDLSALGQSRLLADRLPPTQGTASIQLRARSPNIRPGHCTVRPSRAVPGRLPPTLPSADAARGVPRPGDDSGLWIACCW